MNETLQTLRNKAQELLNLANVDQAFKQLLQTSPELALAGVSTDAFTKGTDQDDGCSWTCAWTCAITSLQN